MEPMRGWPMPAPAPAPALAANPSSCPCPCPFLPAVFATARPCYCLPLLPACYCLHAFLLATACLPSCLLLLVPAASHRPPPPLNIPTLLLPPPGSILTLLLPLLPLVPSTSKPLPLKVLAAVCGHDKDINSLALAPNDLLLATASQDRTAKVGGAWAWSWALVLEHTVGCRPRLVWAQVWPKVCSH